MTASGHEMGEPSRKGPSKRIARPPVTTGHAVQTGAHATLRELVIELARIAAVEDDAAERRRGVAA